MVERIPKKDGVEVEFSPSDSSRGQKGQETDKIKRMGLHQFLSHYDKTQNAYCKAIVLIAFTLYEQGISPENFNLTKESLS